MVRDRLASLISFASDNSLLLLGGALAGSVWANVDLATYVRLTRPLHFWVNDVGMVFFFALAAKEVFEATLPGGALASPARRSRRSRLPLAKCSSRPRSTSRWHRPSARRS